MRILIALLVSVILFAHGQASQPQTATVTDEKVKIANIAKKTKKPVKKAQKKPEDIVAKNPKGCDLNNQWVWSDGSCHDKLKQVAKAHQPPQANVPSVGSNCESYRHLVSQYDWPVDTAMTVMQAESGCNPQTINWGDNHEVCMGSFGLFQISCHSGKVTDPAKNVAIAYAKYQSRGWQPWGVCTNGTVICGKE